MSNPWGGAGAGAWALDAEQAEAEERDRASSAPGKAAVADTQSFPSLKESTATKTKKKKGVTLSLSQLLAPTTTFSGARTITHNDMLRLPTGPKERSAEELEQGRLGGGFRSYGTRSGADGSSWGSGAGGAGGGRRQYGGFEDDSRERPPPRSSDPDLPSRADEVDNWASGKRSFTPMDSSRDRDRDRYSSLGGGGGFSKADEVDNWAAGKKSVPTRYPSFGSGYRESSAPPSDSDRWARGGGDREREREDLTFNGERRRLVLNPPKRDVGEAVNEPARTAATRPSPFGDARPREEILKEKGVDLVKMESEIGKKTSRPTSSQSSRPSSAQSSRPGSPGSQAGGAVEVVVKPRAKVNPFGDAKPREVKLQEQGIDWKKLDLELDHRRVNRPETDDEKLLKEEIDHLKTLIKDIEGNNEVAQASAEELSSLREQILHKESELEVLVRQLDDKVRFAQRSDGRPGSGAGRIGADRPPSQSGMYEESRSSEYMDRPGSRGSTRDVWSHPMEDRRGFQGVRERGFLGERNMDRPRSKPGW